MNKDIVKRLKKMFNSPKISSLQMDRKKDDKTQSNDSFHIKSTAFN